MTVTMKPTHDAPRTACAHHHQRGFSLMEVLVAVMVLAIGLLGLAALQTQGIRFNQDAYTRSQATMLAFDIMDRMRANREALTDYEDYTFDEDDDQCVPTFDPEDDPDSGITSVIMDVICWSRAVDSRLPGATGSIAQMDPPNDDYWQVKMHWVDREPRQFAAGEARRLPASADECTKLSKREWVSGKCTVTQTWSFWP